MQQVGKYQLIRKLATGGMAEVYLAKAAGPRGFEKTLVLKRILPHLAEEPTFVEMFLSEAMLAARLSHPHIVQIFDFGEADGAYFLAMEYIDGPSLRTLIKRAAAQGLPLPTTLCARMVSQACEGLAFAHDFTDPDTGKPLGLIHRDISPDNILLTRQGAAKVVDFGIAKAADQGHRTASGVIKGKISYMPPEQLRAQELDRRVDVYALGVVLYELLTARKPHESTSEVGLMQSILFEPAVPATKHRSDLPEALRHILTRALSKEREQRYPDCHAFQSDLEDYILSAGKPVTAQQVAQLITHVTSTDTHSLPTTTLAPRGPQAPGTPTHTPHPARLGLDHEPSVDVEPTMQSPRSQPTRMETPQPRSLDSSLSAMTPPPEHLPSGTRIRAAAHEPPDSQTTKVRTPRPLRTPVQPLPAAKPSASKAVDARRETAPDTSRGAGRWVLGVCVAALLLGGGGVLLVKTNSAPERQEPPAAATRPEVPPAAETTPPRQAEPPTSTPSPAPGTGNTPPTGTVAEAPPAGLQETPAEKSPTPAEPETSEPQVATRPEEEAKPVSPEPTPATPEPVAEKTVPAPAKPATQDPKRAAPRAKSAAKGILEFRIRPYAIVYVDGKKVGETPLAPLELPAGRHSVRLVNEESGEKKFDNVEIEPNKPYLLKFNFLE
ncbi:serine/threonine protein kinase Pkn6 [Cystobacter fuscus DSM 2262]|uniref:Serine/threonine protein kinase Pkn6 n=1 Tax=Cystobacter fuscus (strain ATCC 25194 / DSM 2262 / NBRC 100088 / M29) TaxID=1242864 RepID=S9QTF7_CYSF2|nr:serine/threonine-protein kinase [Cystobacter fuscus]EPX59948.1 serine/threonine protein kinase Pkn6 [Cystobacter fuscus DSM 2262]